jgi:hypothetical protein
MRRLLVLPSAALLLLVGCSADPFTTNGQDASADGTTTDVTTTDGGLDGSGGGDGATGSCPLKLLNKNTSFEANDGAWALSGSSTTFATSPAAHSGLRSLDLRQVANANYAFAKQDIGAGRTHVRLWYRTNAPVPEFQSLKLEIQPGGPQRTFGAPWPTTWTCATARVESGDGGLGTFFVSGYQPDKSLGASVLVDDLEVYELPADEKIPPACECPQ